MCIHFASIMIMQYFQRILGLGSNTEWCLWLIIGDELIFDIYNPTISKRGYVSVWLLSIARMSSIDIEYIEFATFDFIHFLGLKFQN